MSKLCDHDPISSQCSLHLSVCAVVSESQSVRRDQERVEKATHKDNTYAQVGCGDLSETQHDD